MGEEHRDQGAGMLYQSFVVTNHEINAVIQAAKQFETQVRKGKYVYRLPGGLLGRLTTWPWKRGVNCAGFYRQDIGKN